MGKKVHPKSVRLTINENWSGQWFAKINKGGLRKYKKNLEEDSKIRSHLNEALRNAALEKVEIKRSPQQLNIVIHTARPGLVIGKNGKDIEKLKKDVSKMIQSKGGLKIDIEEVRRPETHARLVARSIAEQLERRLPYRRVMKKTLEKIMLDKELKGVKIRLAGRLNGADIARSEKLSKGKIPLQTFKANIDFAQEVARTTYGSIGIKVWIYKEEVKK